MNGFLLRRRSYTLFAAGLLAGTALSGVATGSVAPVRGATAASAAASSVTRGTVVSVRSISGGVVVVMRKAGTKSLAILIVKKGMVTTKDGHTLDSAAIRPGDAIMRNAAGHIVDLSQHMTHIAGIVAYAPQAGDTSFVLNLSPTREIMVDLPSGTQSTRTDSTGKTSTVTARSLIMSISDADEVHLVGSMDEQSGEVTQTSSIRLTEPKRYAGHKSHG